MMNALRRTIKALFSPLFTVLLFLGMAVYLVQGKFLGGVLRPETMMLFAGVICVQGGGVFLQTCILLSRRTPNARPKRGAAVGCSFSVGVESGVELLLRQGFCRAGDLTGAVYLEKGGRRALFLEAISYVGLLLALGFGMVNYGLGLHGSLQVSPHGERMDFVRNLRVVQKGFLVDLARFDLQLRCEELLDGRGIDPSLVSLQIFDGEGKILANPKISKGERFDVEGFQLRYTGDAYLLSSYITLGNLDLRSLPTFIDSRWGGGDGAYRGALRLMDPGATGTVQFDPTTGLFSFAVTMKDGLQGVKSSKMGETGRDGDFSFTVTSYSHVGRIEIWHHYYRTQIFASLALMFAAVALRLCLGPQRVWLWNDGGEGFFYTPQGALRKKLVEQLKGL